MQCKYGGDMGQSQSALSSQNASFVAVHICGARPITPDMWKDTSAHARPLHLV